MKICLERKIQAEYLDIKIPLTEQKISCPLLWGDQLLINSSVPLIEKILDPKSGLYIYILKATKDSQVIDRTEGILSDILQKLDEEGIEPIDLVKRAWKTSE